MADDDAEGMLRAYARIRWSRIVVRPPEGRKAKELIEKQKRVKIATTYQIKARRTKDYVYSPPKLRVARIIFHNSTITDRPMLMDDALYLLDRQLISRRKVRTTPKNNTIHSHEVFYIDVQRISAEDWDLVTKYLDKARKAVVMWD